MCSLLAKFHIHKWKSVSNPLFSSFRVDLDKYKATIQSSANPKAIKTVFWSLNLKQMIHDIRFNWSILKQWIILWHNGLTDSEFRKALFQGHIFSAFSAFNFSGFINGMTYFRCSQNYNNSGYIYIVWSKLLLGMI